MQPGLTFQPVLTIRNTFSVRNFNLPSNGFPRAKKLHSLQLKKEKKEKKKKKKKKRRNAALLDVFLSAANGQGDVRQLWINDTVAWPAVSGGLMPILLSFFSSCTRVTTQRC